MCPSARLTTDFRERCARTGLTGAVLAATFAEVAEPVPTNTPNENASAVAPAGVKAQLKRRDKCLTRPRLSVDAQSPNTSDEL